MAHTRPIAFAVFWLVFFSFSHATALDSEMRDTLEGHQISLPGDEDSYCETNEDGEIVCGEAAARVRAERKEREERLEKILDTIAEKLEALADSFGDIDGLPSADTVKRVLLGALAAIVVFIVLLILLRLYRRWNPSPVAADQKSAETLLEGLERSTRGRSADDLAAEGNYAGAVHALLLASLRHLREEIPIIEVPSTTSREVVRAARDARRPHVRVLVELVERSRFALEPIGDEEYRRARAAHDAILADGGRR